jgi:uncharacterized protein (TIGR02996 family)
LNEEAGFLSAIRQTPADDTARLVYADWLDERGDTESTSKAEFIRLELRVIADEQSGPADSPKQLQPLASALARDWLAVVSHPGIGACRFTSPVECPKQWARLAPSANTRLRFCDRCKTHVRYCDSIEVAREHVRLRNPIAVSLALVRQPDDLLPLPRPRELVGEVVFTPTEPEPQTRPAWVPEDPPRRRRRQCRKRRKTEWRNRNIQRENWEDQE